jgi:hypothetical protein
MGGSAGGSKGGSKAKSGSQSEFSQDVWGPQGDALQNMYGNAEGLWGQSQQAQDQLGGMAGGIGAANQGVAGAATGGMQDQLGGGAYGDTNAIREQLLGSMGQRSNMGSMYESIVGGSGNTYIDPMVDAMRQSGNQQMDTMQSGTGLDAAAMGQGGSNRHAMQNAMTNAQGAQDMNAQESLMRGGAYDTDLNMKMGIAQQADSNRQQEQDRMMGMLGGANQSQQFGMGQGQNMQNLNMGQMAPNMAVQNQGWGNMNNYANTIGAPTVLGSGSQSGSSRAMSKGGSANGGGGGK